MPSKAVKPRAQGTHAMWKSIQKDKEQACLRCCFWRVKLWGGEKMPQARFKFDLYTGFTV